MDYNILREICKTSGVGDVFANPALLIAEWRNLKLKLALQNIDFEPNIELIKKKTLFSNMSYWNTLKEYKGKSIITGSLALKAFGFIDRPVGDIDLIVDNLDIVKYPGNRHDRYNDVSDLKNLIGYNKIITKKLWFFDHEIWYVDFFEKTNQSFIEKDGFLFQNPIEIMNKKIEMFINRINSNNGNFYDRQKDLEDFLTFNNIINSKYHEKEG